MTTRFQPSPGRSCATPARPYAGLSAVLAACLLGACALPVFAQQAPAADPLEVASAPAALSQPMADAAPMPERSLLFAADLNRLFAAQALVDTEAKPAEPTGRIQSVLKRAMALLGTPYRWGGTTPDGGFDCSGLVGYVFRNALGIELPRVSRDMASQGELISDRKALTAGDLVFFSRRGKRVDHVGIYVGDGQFVHAPRTGKDVMVSNLDTGYWSGKFMQARRVAGI